MLGQSRRIGIEHPANVPKRDNKVRATGFVSRRGMASISRYSITS
jgi:hypothetical protein